MGKKTLNKFRNSCRNYSCSKFRTELLAKTQLPEYIKKNTDYKVSYKTLDVDLGTGNILSTGISVNSKNPQNTNVIGLQEQLIP